MDRSKFIERYKEETKEHIRRIEGGLLALEKNPQDKEFLEVLMREAHSIKGSSLLMGFKRIGDIASKMEDGLEKALNKEFTLEKRHFDMLLKCLDSIIPMLEDKVVWVDQGVQYPFVENLCKEADAVFSGQEKSAKAAGEGKTEGTPIPKKIYERSFAGFENTLRVDISKLNKMVNLSGELYITKIRLAELVSRLLEIAEDRNDIQDVIGDLVKDLKNTSEFTGHLISEVQNEIMGARMVPVSYLFNIFPRAIRDLAHLKGKDVDFVIEGEGTEIDKTIIDEMKDPIMHILRNAVDHGLEAPKERKEKNKPETGRIVLSAQQKGSRIIIEVSDDGGGIDVERVKKRLIENGFITKEMAKDMASEQIIQMIFTPGFSTKDEVTETSGRGVGLDVVREKMAKLKGIVDVVSNLGTGTRFIMKVPLSLAVTESLLVSVNGDTYVIPIDTVVETIRIKPQDVKLVDDREAIIVEKHILPLVRLNDILGFQKKGISEKSHYPAIIAQSVEKKIAILADEMLGRRDIMIKGMGNLLRNIKNISGATILADGRVVLILDIPSIIEDIRNLSAKARPPVLAQVKKKTVLIVEDVSTTAMLEKNILEMDGYSVVIAKDGVEALDIAKGTRFDLVITDILMPNMNGYELTSQLRKNKYYKTVPIIVITTREKDAEIKKGLDAGANEYILKSRFTPELLLETVGRLINKKSV